MEVGLSPLGLQCQRGMQILPTELSLDLTHARAHTHSLSPTRNVIFSKMKHVSGNETPDLSLQRCGATRWFPYQTSTRILCVPFFIYAKHPPYVHTIAHYTPLKQFIFIRHSLSHDLVTSSPLSSRGNNANDTKPARGPACLPNRTAGDCFPGLKKPGHEAQRSRMVGGYTYASSPTRL